MKADRESEMESVDCESIGHRGALLERVRKKQDDVKAIIRRGYHISKSQSPKPNSQTISNLQIQIL
jgi:hypothetical protein